MGKMKVDEIDLDAWDEQEYDPDAAGSFQKYDGEIPPKGTMLRFRVTKMWMTYTEKSDQPMLKVLAVAEDNPGELSDYDGLSCWENLGLFASMKWKTQPFLDFFNLDIRDFKGPKASMVVEDEDDNIGIPITKVKKFTPGSDGAAFVGVTDSERYNGKWQAHIDEWLDPDTEVGDEEEDKKPARSRTRATANGSRSRKPATAGRSRRAKPEPDEEEADEPEEDAPRGRSSRNKAKSSAKPAARGRRSKPADDDDDEPPF